jgi:DNA polymerase zeta
MIKLVSQLHSSEGHLQTRWINALIGRLFLALYKTHEVENFVRAKISKKISRAKKPAFLSDIVIQNISLGEEAPYITNPRLKEFNIDGDCCVEADLSYRGNFRIEVTTIARIDLGTRFKAREVNLVLAIVLKKLEGRGLMRFKAPPSNRIWISFETMPKIEMSIEPIVSSRQITYSLILRQIENRIKEVIAETICLPHWDDIPFVDTLSKPYRGGIWADNPSKDASQGPETGATLSEDESTEFDADTGASTPSHGDQEKSISTPELSSSLPSSLFSRTKGKSTISLQEKADSGISSGVESRAPSADKPKVIRSGSFSASAIPIVSTDTTTVDAVKTPSKKLDQKDAASAMVAISARSQPTSPSASPVGSPIKSSILTEMSGSFSPATPSESEASLADDSTLQSATSKTAHDVYPLSPASMSGSSIKSALSFGLDSKRAGLGQSRGSPINIGEKRSSLAAIGSATAAAKKWGWNVLKNHGDQGNSGLDASGENGERVGTPSNPIGRGHPLPPPGMPLPLPQKNNSKSSPIPVPKRKTPPPQMLPQKTEQSQDQDHRDIQSLPLPKRRTPLSTSSESVDDGILVVAAPPESEPASPTTVSPMADARNEYVHSLELDEDIINADTDSTPASTLPDEDNNLIRERGNDMETTETTGIPEEVPSKAVDSSGGS